jgi:hypothetical protein
MGVSIKGRDRKMTSMFALEWFAERTMGTVRINCRCNTPNLALVLAAGKYRSDFLLEWKV